MDLRKFRALQRAGVSISAIAAKTGQDWRTVKKYLADDAPATPPAAPPRAGTQPRKIGRYAAVVDAWLRADIDLRASVIHERLTSEYPLTELVGKFPQVNRHRRVEQCLGRDGGRSCSCTYRSRGIWPRRWCRTVGGLATTEVCPS